MELPLVDLAPWFDGDVAARRAVATAVDTHLQRCGFLVVVNHGIDPAVMDACRSACLDFFHRPVEEKEEVAFAGGAYRGWVGAGRESNAATYGVDTPPDLKETYAYGPVDVPRPELEQEAPRWFAPNVWPAAPSEFRTAAEAWWRAARGLTDELLALLDLALDQGDLLAGACGETTATVSLNWYWSRRHQAASGGAGPRRDQFRIGPHTDFGSLTILDRQPGAGGLQVLDDDGSWIDAPVVEGALIVNTGDLLRRWSNDRWCSNEHRVLPPPADAPDEELVSLIFFHEPDHDALIAPLPACVAADRPPLHDPVVSGDYLAEKMDALSVQ